MWAGYAPTLNIPCLCWTRWDLRCAGSRGTCANRSWFWLALRSCGLTKIVSSSYSVSGYGLSSESIGRSGSRRFDSSSPKVSSGCVAKVFTMCEGVSLVRKCSGFPITLPSSACAYIVSEPLFGMWSLPPSLNTISCVMYTCLASLSWRR